MTLVLKVNRQGKGIHSKISEIPELGNIEIDTGKTLHYNYKSCYEWSNERKFDLEFQNHPSRSRNLLEIF
jgi:hypothetical protein